MSQRLWVVILSLLAMAGVGTVHGQALPGFSDVTTEAGVTFVFGPTSDTPYNAYNGGGTQGDFNEDGWPDLFIVGGGLTPDRLFINNQDGTFTDMAASAGLTLLYRGNGANAADYDGDGDMDIFVTSYGDVGSAPKNGQHKLWRNNGDVTFTDVAVAAGVNSTGAFAAGSGCAWGDYDLDGDLDLFATGYRWNPAILNYEPQEKLFRNNLAQTGSADFSDVTAAAGLVTAIAIALSPIFVDIDGDRYPELLVAGDFNATRFYRNNRDSTFTAIALPMVVGDTKVFNGMGNCIGDFNRDGLMDWYVTAMYPSWYFAGPPGNHLYMNLGGGLMQSLPASAGVTDGGWGWGTATIDFDNDGWQDIVETNGWLNCDPVTLECFQNEPSYLFKNNGDNTFSEVHAANGLVNVYDGRGLITLDYDRDGDMDVVILSNPKVSAGEDPLSGNLQLNRNNICDTHGPVVANANFLEVVLDTSATPVLAPDGYGAHVSVRTGAVLQHFQINGGCNYLSRSQLVAHFGIADATVVDELTVTWPNGDISVQTGVPANQILTVSSSMLTWATLGSAKDGATGTPLLAGSGALSANSLNQLTLSSVLPSTSATLVFGFVSISAPFKGGTLVPAPLILVPLASSPAGDAVLPFLLPAGIPPGFSLYFQFWIKDPGASFGLAASNGLLGQTN